MTELFEGTYSSLIAEVTHSQEKANIFSYTVLICVSHNNKEMHYLHVFTYWGLYYFQAEKHNHSVFKKGPSAATF